MGEVETLQIADGVFVTPDQVVELIGNVKSLKGQRDEMITDITEVLKAITEIGEKFQDKNKIMGLISQLPKLMISKDPKFMDSIIPMGAFKHFALKYGPICFPEESQNLIAESHE